MIVGVCVCCFVVWLEMFSAWLMANVFFVVDVCLHMGRKREREGERERESERERERERESARTAHFGMGGGIVATPWDVAGERERENGRGIPCNSVRFRARVDSTYSRTSLSVIARSGDAMFFRFRSVLEFTVQFVFFPVGPILVWF